jgi:hypothetical protein
MKTQDKDKSNGRRPVIILLPVLILAGLLLSASTRSLLKTQMILLVDSTAFAAHLRDMGVKAGPMPAVQKWDQSPPAEVVAHTPDDYTLQIAGALIAGTNTPGSYRSTPQEHYVDFQRRFGERLAATSLHFPDRPGPYAHLLRYMTMGTVRVSREGEAARFQAGATMTRLSNRQIGCAESWAAFDNAATQGEKVDPDNAYFPLMRAIGLFDAKRDAEGVAAILRAGQKSRFDDYSLEEPAAAWTLYRRTYGVESALLRESTYAALLLPHFAAIRSMARLTVAKAAEAEAEGRTQEGLALRHAMMQCAARMRAQGDLLGAMVGNSIFSNQMHFPGGASAVPLPRNATDKEKIAVGRNAYLAYLHRLGQTQECDWVQREDAVNEELRSLIHEADKAKTGNAPLHALPGFWIIDMLLLANILALLLLCGGAVLIGLPKMRCSEKLLPWAALLVMVCCMLAAFQMQWAEALTQMRMVLDNLAWSAVVGSNSDAVPTGVRMTEIITRYPGIVHVAEVLLSLAVPVVTLLLAGITGLVRKEPFAAALLRSLQRGALVFLSLLTAMYALSVVATARLEFQAGADLDARTHNAVAYLKHQAEVARKP